MRTSWNLATIGWVVMACGSAAASAAPAADPALAEARAIFTQAHAIAQRPDAAPTSTSTNASATQRLEDLSRRLDRLRMAMHMPPGTDDALSHKFDAVSHYLTALRVPTSRVSLSPAQLPSARRTVIASIAPHQGGACHGAIGIEAGSEVDARLPADGEIWLHVASSATPVRIDTSATAVDSAIEVFGACPAAGDTATVSADDDIGLSARVVLPAGGARDGRWLRVRNLGATGGVAIVAATTGAITGMLRDTEGNPLDGWVAALTPAGNTVDSTFVSTGMNYTLSVDSGQYYVVASSDGRVVTAWPNVECPGYYYTCNLEVAQSVTVTGGATTSGIDFSLGQGGRIIGRVREAASGLLLPGAAVHALNANGDTFWTNADATGRYSIPTLPAGTYRVWVEESTHLPQRYNDLDCPTPPQTCAFETGTPIAIARNASRDGIDFSLKRMPYISVRTNLLPGGAASYPMVQIYDANGASVASGYADDGETRTIGPFAPGTYRVVASADGYASQLFDHIACNDDCSSQLASATPIAIDFDAPIPLATFDLSPRGEIHGRITDLADTTPLEGVAINVYPSNGIWPLYYTTSAADGTYATKGLPAGSYWVVAVSPDHRDTAYPNAACSDLDTSLSHCELGSAQLVVVGEADVAGIDVAMPRNATITGIVSPRASFPLSPWAQAYVTVYDDNGTQLRLAYMAEGGSYSIADLPAGSYFATAGLSQGFGQIYDGIDCPLLGSTCSPLGGTPLSLVQGQLLTGVDFVVTDARQVVGRVTDATTGNGVPGVAIDAWNVPSATHCDAAITGADGSFAVGHACGGDAIALSTDAGGGYVDQVYDDQACPNGPAYSGLCPLANASHVSFPTAPVVSQADFVLTPRDPDLIFGDGFDSASMLARRGLLR